ncbi:hypothetical protein [Mastigocladopsis repens]|uniref:hypothetical protein n=1 Tax=Mastigocladopsis repens TaxID=221287 RepID=UPI0002F0F770|nr:hypothetical protein [Mastigocladopsis repens]
MKYALIASALMLVSGLGFETGIVIAQTTSKPSATLTPTQTTVANFQTENYSVRVFRQGSQTRMNLFDKRTNKLQLNAAPVQVERGGQQTNYTTSEGERLFRISVDQAGNRSVEINGPGQVIQEMTN